MSHSKFFGDPRHHGMGRRHFEDAMGDQQVWRTAENVLNKTSRTADKGLRIRRRAKDISP